MAGRGPAPKQAHLRQRTNKKAGASMLQLVADDGKKAPKIPNPDGREWHPLTLAAWAHAWASPMAPQWLETDTDALGRLAILWDTFYREPDTKTMAEIRQQEARFGLSPLDRSRLQWEISRGDAAEKQQERRQMAPRKTGTLDPRQALMAVK
jgi:hypothetical protein